MRRFTRKAMLVLLYDTAEHLFIFGEGKTIHVAV